MTEDRGAILIVDDDAEFRSLVSTVLARTGLTMVEVASGEDVIRTSKANPPRLVLLDIRLPGINGYEVCRELREEFGEGLPIVFVSGERTDSLDRSVGMLVGGDDYVVKPFDPDDLLARVRRLLERSHANGNAHSEAHRLTGLTRRELETLKLLAAGKQAREIAAELVISEKTVSSHLQRVLEKLNVNSRAQAVAVAYREGLVETGRANGAHPDHVHVSG